MGASANSPKKPSRIGLGAKDAVRYSAAGGVMMQCMHGP
jgi:hypothetical protein